MPCDYLDVVVLFARRDSIYKTLAGCDVWDAERDALRWSGGLPVIAHPPCRAWGNLRQFAKPLPGEKDLAPWAIDQVRRYGGVLEHPARSTLWPVLGLPEPDRDYVKTFDEFGGFTIVVDQNWWGHRAQKRTRLYICGCSPADVPVMPLVLGEAERVIGSTLSKCGRSGLSRRGRETTPGEFARWLVKLAKRCDKQQRMAA